MTAVSRSDQFAKVHKVLKKHYKPAPASAGRTVMEHLLFACCLEDAPHEAAEEAFAALVHTFFDWNEVRVTSISELSEVMACLPDARAAANRIKRRVARRLRGQLQLRTGRTAEEEPRPDGRMVSQTRRHDPLHGGLRRSGGAGRTFHSDRRRHDGGAPRCSTS